MTLDERPAVLDDARRPGSLPYNPAFDGIRGLAVAAVMLFHHGVSWMQGGYLGVSTFFTLSGFLITTLLLTEQARSGSVRLSRFWARRIRRLLPASALTLLAVALLALVVDQPWERSLRGDLLAALAQVANWRFLFADRSYGELFAQPSPVLHFWSLAIEEQFYWVFPLVTVGILRFAGGRRRVFAAALAGTIAGSAALTFVLGADHRDAVYYGTFTRMAEILAGALLATVLLTSSNLPPFSRLSPRKRGRVGGIVGALALVASVFAWVTVGQSDAGLYQGGLLVYAALSTALVAGAALSPQLRPVLGWAPLRALGLISYGAYLLHWPIYLVLDSDRTGLAAGGFALATVRIGVTLVLATLSFVLLEQPVRRGRWPVGLPVPTPAVAGGTVATVAVVALLVPVVSPPPEALDPFAIAQQRAEAEIKALPPEVPRVLFFGDSSALMIGAGVGDWGLETEQLGAPGGAAVLGCGIGRGGQLRQFGTVGPMPGSQCDWSETWPAEIERRAEHRSSIAVVLTGSWDVVDRKIPGDDRWRGPGDPVYDEFLAGEIAGATQVLQDAGLTVVWLTTPPLDFGRNRVPRPPVDPADTPARVDRLNELINETVSGLDGVAVVDLHSWFAGLSPQEDTRLRPDGVHVEMTTAREPANWLAPRILEAAERVSQS